jgi:hypothetical protein
LVSLKSYLHGVGSQFWTLTGPRHNTEPLRAGYSVNNLLENVRVLGVNLNGKDDAERICLEAHGAGPVRNEVNALWIADLAVVNVAEVELTDVVSLAVLKRVLLQLQRLGRVYC